VIERTRAAQEDDDEEDEKAAWEDSDDDRVAVSLASVPRLRKLRKTEQEDVVSGKEYIRRLRQQFLRLNPAPEWVSYEKGKAKKKRKKTKRDFSDEEVSSDDDNDEMDVDEDLSTQPLAKLLKSADFLTNTNELQPRKRRKLQPEIIRIQPLKDIAGEQPVSRPKPIRC
jgi:U3 small nucleolar RNA-associated protein 18